MTPSVYNCSVIQLPKTHYRAGNLTAVENSANIPFEVRRIFYIYDIPGGKDRGAHAHKKCHQFLIAASGSFEVEMDDGTNKKTVHLNRPDFGLHIPPGIWAAEKNFSSGSICLVLASELYDKEDYLRSYLKYKRYLELEIEI